MDPLRGAELDAAVERKIESDNAEAQLKEMYVDLDTLADSRDISVELARKLREAQRAVARAHEQAEDDLDDMNEILD